MSGDKDPRFVVRACAVFCRRHTDAHLILIGNPSDIQAGLSDSSVKSPDLIPTNISIVESADVVSMTDQPAKALRNKRESSMSITVKMHSEGKVDACWSAGNTGALMAFGLHWLKPLEGVERPAICKAIPTKNHTKSFLLDIGANPDCTPKNLLQFAQLGNRLARSAGIQAPKIALLNVGVESHKGGQLQKEAEALIKKHENLNYTGFIESDALFEGQSHVIVCDGFNGNAILKACEGTAEFMLTGLKQAFQKHWANRLLAWLIQGLLKQWRNSYNPDDLNGAVFLGLNGIVVKSHGSADERGLLASLQVAYDQALAKTELLRNISEEYA